MFETIKGYIAKAKSSYTAKADFIRATRGEINPAAIVTLVIGMFLAGILLPIAIRAWESFTPTNSTNALVYPLVVTFFLIGLGLMLLKSAQSSS